HLHHLDRTTGKSELHPHERTRPRPGNEIVAGGDEEPFVGQLAVDFGEKWIGGSACLTAAGGNGLAVRSQHPGFAQFHSSAPFFNSRIKTDHYHCKPRTSQTLVGRNYSRSSPVLAFRATNDFFHFWQSALLAHATRRL